VQTQEANKMSQDKDCMEAFINAIKNHPVIYSLTHKDHKDQVKVGLAWKKVVEEIKAGFPADVISKVRLSSIKEVKAKYYNLR